MKRLPPAITNGAEALFGIYNDLEDTIEYCTKAKAAVDGEPDLERIRSAQALFIAGVVSYFRCFKTNAKRPALNKPTGEWADKHTMIEKVRDKLIAHSDGYLEEVGICFELLPWPEPFHVARYRPEIRRLALSDHLLDTLLALAQHSHTTHGTRCEAALTELHARARAVPRDQLEALPEWEPRKDWS